MNRFVPVLSFALALMGTWPALAQVDGLLYYEGTLSEPDGTPVDGVRNMAFRLHAAPDGGDAVWEEAKPGVGISGGNFGVYLGEAQPLDPSMFNRGAMFLEVVVDGRPLQPRLRIAGAPYASVAELAVEADHAATAGMCLDADALQGRSAADFAAADHNHDGRYQRPQQQACPAGRALRSVAVDGVPDCVPVSSVDEAVVDGWVSNNGYQQLLARACPDGQAISSVAPDGTVTCQDVGSGDGHSLDAAGGGQQDAVFVAADGNVGIGTLNPGALLEVAGNTRIAGLGGAANRMVVADETGLLGTQAIPQIPNLDNLPGTHKVLTQENLLNLDVSEGDIVRVDGVVEVDRSVDTLEERSLSILGGTFRGIGEAELELYNYTTVVGTTFENIRIEGFEVTFVNCDFRGNIKFPHYARILGGSIEQVTASSDGRLGFVHHVDIEASSIPNIQSISGSHVSRSQLGSREADRYAYRVEGNLFNSVSIQLGSHGTFLGNSARNSHLVLSSDNNGQVQIIGNIFDDLLDGESEAIQIDGSGRAYRSYIIANNNFMIQNADPRAITVVGLAEGTYQVLRITGNSFVKGQTAIGYVGSFKTLIDNNMLHSVELGVAASNTVRLRDNESW